MAFFYLGSIEKMGYDRNSYYIYDLRVKRYSVKDTLITINLYLENFT